MTTVIDAIDHSEARSTYGTRVYPHRADLKLSTGGFARLADFVIEQRHGAIER